MAEGRRIRDGRRERQCDGHAAGHAAGRAHGERDRADALLAPLRVEHDGQAVNAGLANEAGIETGANYYLSDEWLVRATFSYYSFDVLSKNVNDVLLPNSPKYKVGGGVTYTPPN